jgi:hypothetical protein
VVQQGEEGKEGLRRVLNEDQATLLQQEIYLLEDVLAFLQNVRTMTTTTTHCALWAVCARARR